MTVAELVILLLKEKNQDADVLMNASGRPTVGIDHMYRAGKSVILVGEDDGFISAHAPKHGW